MADSTFRTTSGVPVASVTADEMRAVDRVAVEDVGFALLQMMENAGRTLASHVLAVGDGPALVVAGNGGNGGGGLVCARHLANHDVPVEVVLDRDPERLTGATARQCRILDTMGVQISTGTDGFGGRENVTVLVDALIGYGLGGSVREPARTLVGSMNRHGAPIVSLDVPSGIDATTGETRGVAIVPDRTVTLALPKPGLSDRDGSLFLADIGIPHTVFDRLDVEYENPFGLDDWVELER